jgi:hypothetical protein
MESPFLFLYQSLLYLNTWSKSCQFSTAHTSGHNCSSTSGGRTTVRDGSKLQEAKPLEFASFACAFFECSIYPPNSEQIKHKGCSKLCPLHAFYIWHPDSAPTGVRVKPVQKQALALKARHSKAQGASPGKNRGPNQPCKGGTPAVPPLQACASS